MGRGKSWSREESEAVAKAWKETSEQGVPVREQNSKAFVCELYRRFIELEPNDPDAVEGRWKSRSQTAVKTQFDAIADDVGKFNNALSKITEQAISRGLSLPEEDLLRAAIALHLSAVTGPINFDTIDAVEGDWKLFEAWRILRTSPRFAPPNWPTVSDSLVDQDQDDDSASGPSHQARHASSMDNGNLSYSIPSPSHLHSTGPPMRTLATAALSMNLVGNGLSTLPPIADHSVSGVAAQIHGDVEKSPYHRSVRGAIEKSGTREGKRRKRQVDGGPKRPAPSPKEVKRAHDDVLSSSSNALELVGHAIGTLGDALSEYNAITLFSRVDMQGMPEQKAFFEALAEKHALKAKLDRDKLVRKAQQLDANSKGSHTFSD